MTIENCRSAAVVAGCVASEARRLAYGRESDRWSGVRWRGIRRRTGANGDRSERGVLRRSEGLGEGAAGDWTSLVGAGGVVLGRQAECVEAALEAVARSIDGEDFGVVEEAVEDGGGERFVAEGVGPFADGLAGGDDG